MAQLLLRIPAPRALRLASQCIQRGGGTGDPAQNKAYPRNITQVKITVRSSHMSLLQASDPVHKKTVATDQTAGGAWKNLRN